MQYWQYFSHIMAGPSFVQTWIPCTLVCIVPSLVEIGPVVHILHPRMHCAKFHWNWPSGSYPFGKRQSPTFEQTWIPFTQSRFVPSFGWNWPSGSGEDFSNWSMYFRFFIIISPSKRVWPFIWTNLKNPLYPRMHCAKFGWNWPIGSEEDDFTNSSMYFHNFVIISPWTGQSPSF